MIRTVRRVTVVRELWTGGNEVAVTIRLDSTLEKRVQSRAAAAGVSVEGCIELLLPNSMSAFSRERMALHGQELDSELAGLAAYSEKIPLLPLAVLTREGIYQDHD
jgi:hypothetical protein